MSMMATGGALLSDMTCKTATRGFDGIVVTFQYPLSYD